MTHNLFYMAIPSHTIENAEGPTRQQGELHIPLVWT